MLQSPRATLAAVILLLTAACSFPTTAQDSQPPLLPEPVIRAIAGELSGTAAKRTVQDFTLFHRMRGSRGFRAAAERVRDRAQEYGLQQVEILELPADGKVFYGTQRSRPAWDADFAELWEQEKGDGGAWTDSRLVASWESRPVSLAQDSASGEAAADLIDVGAGTAEADYQGKAVKGNLVLTSSQPSAVYGLAVDRFGAAGIVSYAQNQVTAWYKEDETLVRWGHLPTFPAPKTFAFMVSLQQARAWQERLANGEAVHLRASVRAGQHSGFYSIATAVLPGSDPQLAGEEIVLSCHLDHLRPGANDNASGCATILEVGRTLAKLVREGKIPPPRRTLRWVWPPEIEGSIALLNARPDIARRARAVLHMDMVGGDADKTKAIFHVTRSPKSLPTFVNDVGEAFGRFVNAQSDLYASKREAAYPLVDPDGDKRALQAAFVDYSEGSDHQVWTEGSWRVPAIYLNDWPDRYIHTTGDTVANIDATKLLRAGFLGAASAYYLANLDAEGVPALWDVVRRHALERTSDLLARRDRLHAEGKDDEIANLLRFHRAYEEGVLDSIAPFATVPGAVRQDAVQLFAALQAVVGPVPDAPVTPPSGAAAIVYHRAPDPKGPMAGFGYQYLEDKRTQLDLAEPALAGYQGLWGDGAYYTYEALNLVDGKRTVQEIRDALAAIYGPVPLTQVAEFLGLLHKIGVVSQP